MKNYKELSSRFSLIMFAEVIYLYVVVQISPQALQGTVELVGLMMVGSVIAYAVDGMFDYVKQEQRNQKRLSRVETFRRDVDDLTVRIQAQQHQEERIRETDRHGNR